jgi:hypothetical protein
MGADRRFDAIKPHNISERYLPFDVTRNSAGLTCRIPMADITPRQAFSDAVHYWEPRRRIYNLALSVVVAVVFLINLPGSRASLTFDTLEKVFSVAVLANLAYCVALAVDVALQISAFRAMWLRNRWLLLVIGIAAAGVFVNSFSQGLFARPLNPAFVCVKDCD